MDLSKQLDGFELKLRQLASQIDRQRAEKESLVAENNRLKRELDRQSGVVSALKEKLENAALGGGEAVSDDPSESANGEPTPRGELKAEIDFCLREIDKCIEWLQQQ